MLQMGRPFRFLLGTIAAGAIYLQAVEPLRFEVVSIKLLDDSMARQNSFVRNDPSRVRYPRANLTFLLMRAFGVKSYQIDGPSWAEGQLYDIEAKIPEGGTQEQVPAMLQSMLAERFGLKAHWGTRSQSSYALLVAKGGPKLKRSEEVVAQPGSDGKRAVKMSFSTSGHLEFHRRTMSEFAQSLSVYLGRPVLDMTGVEGVFNIVMDVNPADLEGLQRMMASSGAGVQNTSSAPSIFVALQELGLKLESRKDSIRHLVIDDARRIPTAN